MYVDERDRRNKKNRLHKEVNSPAPHPCYLLFRQALHIIITSSFNRLPFFHIHFFIFEMKECNWRFW